MSICNFVKLLAVFSRTLFLHSVFQYNIFARKIKCYITQMIKKSVFGIIQYEKLNNFDSIFSFISFLIFFCSHFVGYRDVYIQYIICGLCVLISDWIRENVENIENILSCWATTLDCWNGMHNGILELCVLFAVCIVLCCVYRQASTAF